MHLNDEALHAFLDHEYDDLRHTQAAEHLAACTDCRARLDAIQARAALVQARLDLLAPTPAQAPRAAQLALARLNRRAESSGEEKLTMLKSIFAQRFRPLWVGLCVVALFTVALSYPPVRAWAGDLLARFRVQRITVVQVDNTRLTELTGNSGLAKQIGQLVSDSINVTKEPGKPQVVANAAEASQRAGFNVRLPGGRTDLSQLTVQGGAAFDFVVNRQRAQAILDQIGATNIKLPASLDGADIKVNIPAGVSAGYGNCPKVGDTTTGSTARRFSDCTLLIEIPSPTVDTPPDLDVQQLAELALQFTGMPADQAHSFSQKVDWTSTLVIPIPRNGATYKELTVDGTTGYLIQRPVDDAPQFVIVWTKDGIIYAVGAVGSDTTKALQIANSLK